MRNFQYMRKTLWGLFVMLLMIFVSLKSAAIENDLSHKNASLPTIKIGSKAFTESHILAEIMAQLLEFHQFNVQRKLGLGGTLIAYEALKGREIDVYPEYTGTLAQVILKRPELKGKSLEFAAQQEGFGITTEFGFNNTYALVVMESFAEKHQLQTMSDLSQFETLQAAFSHEFLNREDGWPALQKVYQYRWRPRGIEHALAYDAMSAQQLDVTDAYTTDGELEGYELRLLLDDKAFFPEYLAIGLSHNDLPLKAQEILNTLSSGITASEMKAMNARVGLENESPATVATDFLVSKGLLPKNNQEASDHLIQWDLIRYQTLQHLKLTGIALFFACLIAIPIGLWVSQRPWSSKFTLYSVGLIQTIPSLALLALMIPLFGLGQITAITALFLYSLLPIMRNTVLGIRSIDPLLIEVSMALGLNRWQRLQKIEWSLALPVIFAGIRTATIISIGTATLAAFVGAQGLGEPIITGLTLNQPILIFHGAIPAVLLAIMLEVLFDVCEKLYFPKGLQANN